MKNILSEIMELFSGILVMGNGLANMTIFGLSESPMTHTDIWKSPLSVFISLLQQPFMARNRRKNMLSII